MDMPPPDPAILSRKAAIVSGLRAILPADAVIDDPAGTRAYECDALSAYRCPPLAVVLPRSTADVSAALRFCHDQGVPVVPRGAGTGLAGGATAIEGCLVISTEAMTTIRELDPANRIAVAEAGVINAHLDRAAREVGLMYAPDPSSYELCTIGGNVATNAGGLRCVKYGVTRDAVLGLEVVLPDGRVLHTGGRTVKNVAGYSQTQLFIGSEGTLGVVTAATVKLLPVPPVDPVTVVAGFDDIGAAGEAVSAIIAAGMRPSLLELMDEASLQAVNEWKNAGLDGTRAMVLAQSDDVNTAELARQIGALCEAAGGEVAISEDAAEARALLDVRRLALPAAERLGLNLVEDVGVPPSRLAEMVRRVEAASARHGVRIITVAHAGDGNLHPIVIVDRAEIDGGWQLPARAWAAIDEVFAAALDLGGTLTGEHGIGLLKKKWLPDQLGEVGTELNQAIKRAIDPLGIMNPGRAI